MPLRLRDRRASEAAFAGYAAISFVYMGARLLPHPGRWYIGAPSDPQIFIWSFAWWPHALVHGINPFVTHEIWAPGSYGLAWTTDTPLLAVAFAPLTWLFGPVVSYDLATMLMPVLAAWSAFLLCRHLTRRLWPSLVGGYLFGFSSYMIGQLDSHLHMSSVFPLPLVALVAVRYLEGGLGGRGLIVRLGPLLACELWLSLEVSFSLAVVLAAALVLGLLLVPEARARIVSLVPPLAGAYAVAAVLAAPLVYFALSDYQSGSINLPQLFSTDLANLVVPTGRFLAGGHWGRELADAFPGNDSERDAYIGLPVLLIVAWFALGRRREAGARFLTAAAVLAVVASCGWSLQVDGRRVVAGPWGQVGHFPLFDNVLPARLMVYAWLAIAVMAALWTAGERSRLRIALPVLAVATLVPTLSLPFWRTRVVLPPFFRDGDVRRCLAPSDNVLMLPQSIHGDAMLRQAVSGFPFTMADGYLRPDIPPYFVTSPAVARVASGEVTGPDLLRFAREKHLAAVLVEEGRAEEWRAALAPLGPPQAVGGMLLYRLDRRDRCRARAA